MNPQIQTQLPKYARALFEPRRYTVLYGGRGSGKSHSVARALLLMAAQSPHRVLCCREFQRSIKDSVHRLLCDCIKALGLESFYTVTETEIRGINGSLFIFSGLSNVTVDSIKSLEGVTLCWAEEAHVISDRSWSILIPTIRAKGSRFFITLNPQLESDPTSQRFLVNDPPDCLKIRVNYDLNPWFPPELDRERIYHQSTQPDTYGHVWLGEHLPAVEGAVYFREAQAMEREGRIRLVPIDPLLKVHTVWDLGMADHTAIGLVQAAGNAIMIVGYIQDNNRALSTYVQDLQKLPYNWGSDFLPHDAWHRDLTSGKSPADVLQMMGRKPERVANMPLEDGIKLTRETLGRVYIDSGLTQLIDCIKRYRWHIPQGNNGQLASRPFHDEFSHGADMLRYLCIASPDMHNMDSTWGKPLDYSFYDRATI